MVQSRTACNRHFESIQAPRGGLLHLARFQHQCAGPEGSSHARALSRLGLGSDLRHRRQWWRLDRAPLYGTAASEAADSWCPVKTARQIFKAVRARYCSVQYHSRREGGSRVAPTSALANLRLHSAAHHAIEIEQPKGRTDTRVQFILARLGPA